MHTVPYDKSHDEFIAGYLVSNRFCDCVCVSVLRKHCTYPFCFTRSMFFRVTQIKRLSVTWIFVGDLMVYKLMQRASQERCMCIMCPKDPFGNDKMQSSRRAKITWHVHHKCAEKLQWSSVTATIFLNVYSSSQSNPWDAQGSQTQTRENYWAIIYS